MLARLDAFQKRSAEFAGRISVDPGQMVVLFLLVVIIAVGFGFADRFGTTRNFANVFEQSAALGMISLGQTLVILTGGIDLSIGSLINLSSVLTSGEIDGDAARVGPVVVGVLALGMLIGAMNGALTLILRVHPLIITLGMATILQGVTLLYSLSPPGSVPFEFEFFAYYRIGGAVPFAGLFMLGLFLIVGLVLNFTVLGRHIYAVGGNPEAARLAGISRSRVIIFVYSISGLMAAMTGIYFVSRLGIGEPWVGRGMDLASITPVVVGGTILAGGRGGVFGTFLGVLLLSLLNNLLNMLDVSSFYQWIVQGLIIIIAVSIYVQRQRRI